MLIFLKNPSNLDIDGFEILISKTVLNNYEFSNFSDSVLNGNCELWIQVVQCNMLRNSNLSV